MQHNYVYMRLIFVNKQHNYLFSLGLKCRIFHWLKHVMADKILTIVSIKIPNPPYKNHRLIRAQEMYRQIRAQVMVHLDRT